MPTPNLGESLNEFIARCIPIVLEDGAAEDNQQAVAVCTSMYEERETMENNKQHEHKTVAFKVTALDFEGRTMEGYAAVFGNVDQGGDIIHRGAFAKTLVERGNKVRFLWQHNWDEPIGKPLEMREDDNGLYIKAIISDTERGRDALALLRDGAIDGMSIGYDAIPGGTDMSKADGATVRNLRELRLWEFSLVTFPMNEEATVTALKHAEGDAETKAIGKATEARLMQAIEAAHNAIGTIEALLENAGITDEDTAPAEDAGRDTEMDNDKAGSPSAPTSAHDHLELERQQILTQIQMMEASNE